MKLWPYLAIAAVTASFAAPHGTARVHWSTDGLFYQAKTLQLRGASEHAALRATFLGQPGRAQRYDAGSTPGFARTSDWRWIDYSKQLYERRLLVPALAAAVYPAFHERSVLVVSLAGYVLFGLLLVGVLRRRCSRSASFAVAAFVVLLEPVQTWSFMPLTDSWGLALGSASLLAALLVVERGLRWLPAWALSIVALSFTRESALLFVAAATGFVLFERSRRALALAGTSVLALAPSVLTGAPIRTALAYGFSGNVIPRDDSWSFVARAYPSNLHAMLADDLPHIATTRTLPIVVVCGFAAAALLYVVRTRRVRHEPVLSMSVIAALMIAGASLLANAFGFALLNEDFPYGLFFVVGAAGLVGVRRAGDTGLLFTRLCLAAGIAELLAFPQARDFRAELLVAPFVAVGAAELGRGLARLTVSDAAAATPAVQPARVQ